LHQLNRSILLSNEDVKLGVEEMDLLTAQLLIVFLLILCIILGLLLFRNYIHYYFGIDASPVHIENIKIPVDDIELNAKLVIPEYYFNMIHKSNSESYPPPKLPIILVNHGWNNTIKDFMYFAISLSIGGPFACLIYDCRGHGKSMGEKKLNDTLYNDIPKIVSYAQMLSIVDSSKIGFIGISMGGAIGLTTAYNDTRIKAIVSMSAFNDFNVLLTTNKIPISTKIALFSLKLTGLKEMPEESNKKISPAFVIQQGNTELNQRVFLIHAKNDTLVPFSNFEENQRLLDLPDNQILIFKKGDHGLFKQEVTCMCATLNFFKEKFEK
jgi:esterase/lipase